MRIIAAIFVLAVMLFVTTQLLNFLKQNQLDLVPLNSEKRERKLP